MFCILKSDRLRLLINKFMQENNQIQNSDKKTLKGNCYSCLMPFNKDPLGENREDERNCSYCFNSGKLCYEGTDVKEFKKAMVDAIVARGGSQFMANIYAFMAGFAPRWKNNK